jgi:hypothetical protein
MNTQQYESDSRLSIPVSTVCIAVAIVFLAQPALAQLPPRPEPESPNGPASAGGQVRLHVQFPQDWPWGSVHWQDLWTVVQWQDEWSAWHDVEGWRGTLDTVEVGKDGAVVGLKVWWVGPGELGKGPFRWLVYQGESGALLAASEPFDLPACRGGVVKVEVWLK